MSTPTSQTEIALRALIHQNANRFPGRIRSIAARRLPRAEALAEMVAELRNHRECVYRIATEPPFAAWIAGGCVTR